MIPTLVHFDYLLRIESMIGEQAERLMDSLRSCVASPPASCGGIQR